MSKYVKELLQNELERKFSDVENFVVLNFKGVDGNENNNMRGTLKDKGINVTLVKNAMMRRAMSNLEREPASELFLEGPCAVAYGGDSVVDIAKELEDWIKKFKQVDWKGAFIDGAPVDAEAAKSLTKMKSRVELQGEVVSIAMTPGSNLAGSIGSPASNIAGCVKSLIEKLEEAA